MRVTIKDIAKKTGLSVSTVSLVLNHKSERISQKTIHKVLKAAEEMHYHPNQIAVGLITRKTQTLGLIIPDIVNTFFAEIAKGAEAECQKCGYSLILCNTNDNPQKDVDYVNVLVDKGVDGILFTMAVSSQVHKDTQCFQIMKQVEKPMVLVDRAVWEQDAGCAAPSVTVDNELGGYLATNHLLELGHRKIGFISGPMGEQSSQKRLFGYIRALQEFSVTFDPILVRVGDYHTPTGYRLSGELIEQGVTAIFACNDMMAYGIYQQAKERGLSIPGDLSVVGFDDLQFSQFMEVPLTSMKQPAYEIGRCAVDKIIGMIENPDENQKNVQFKPKLMVRKSTEAVGEKK
ncbi:hypothetical protein A7X67_01950 [Clostridium sp. W14A]|nr:hypothetical protein A7X67_01950 [Clostridium sp. W14A]